LRQRLARAFDEERRMCGRFTLVRLSDFLDRFPWITAPQEPPSQPPALYNIAPSQPIAAVVNEPQAKAEYVRWGLVPSWATDASIGNRMINARAETLAKKPAFARLLRRRRCLIPADGFYEWRRNAGGKTKTPMHIRMRDGRPFAFAGLWDKWRDPDGHTLRSCTIITTSPNELMRPIHDRMPVILHEADYQRWLGGGEDAEKKDTAELERLLAPYTAAEMEAYAVSTAVNSPINDSPHNIEPAPADERETTKMPDEQPSLFPKRE
jgi:putative SOS response-associated peptidase YedK